MLGSRVEASFDCAVGAALAKTVKQAATTTIFSAEAPTAQCGYHPGP